MRDGGGPSRHRCPVGDGPAGARATPGENCTVWPAARHGRVVGAPTPLGSAPVRSVAASQVSRVRRSVLGAAP